MDFQSFFVLTTVEPLKAASSLENHFTRSSAGAFHLPTCSASPGPYTRKTAENGESGAGQPVGLLVRSRGILLDVDHQRPIRRNLLVR
jgi:hypothetical protein